MTFTANTTIVTRHNPAGNYSQLDNSPVRNKNLSTDAKALLWYLGSNSDKWYIVMKNVQEVLGIGINRLRKAFAQLAEWGYAIRTQLRDASGLYRGYGYEITLIPGPNLKNSEVAVGAGQSGARVPGAPFSVAPIPPPIIRLNSDPKKKKDPQDILPSIPCDYSMWDNMCAEDEELDVLRFSLSRPESQQPEAFQADLYSDSTASSAIGTALVSGVGESSAADYIITTNDNQTTETTKPQHKLSGTEKRAAKREARSAKQSAQRSATLEAQGKEKGLWQSMDELNAFIAALTAHTVENTRIHSPKSWVMSEVKKAVVDGVSLNWDEFKSTGKVSQANKRPVTPSDVSTPLYGNSQAQEFRDWYDWAKKAGLVDYSYSDPKHYAIVVMGDGITLPWRDAKAQFPKC